MKNNDKTQEQLLRELARMRQRIAELEQSEAERQRAEEALKASEEKYRSLFDNALEGVYHTTPDGRIVDANMACAAMFGYDSPEEVINDVRDIARQLYANPEDRLKVVALLTEKGYVKDFECPMRRKDGSTFRAAINARSARLHEGAPCFEGFIVDITERKEAEEALRESERKLSEAQKMAQLGHWKWDVRTGEVEWSEEVFRIFRLDPGTFTPQIDSILALSPWPEDHERDRELVRKAMESHERGSYEQRFLRPDKSIGYYVSSFQGTYDDKGNLLFIVGTVQDITERKMEEQEREKLIHELRDALSQVRTLRGLLPICSSCKRIKNEKGQWEYMETYIRDRSQADFSHGICPECAQKLYPEYYKQK